MSVYSVNVCPSSATIKTGEWYYYAYAEVDASSNCDKDVEWYSDSPSVASVSQTYGYIYGISPGTAKIYARSKVDSSKEDYITVKVTSGTICVESVCLNRSSISLEKGDTFNLSATVCPENATNRTINWRSTDTSVATVSGGVVTAKARGWTYIFAEAQDGSGEYDSCYVNVTEDILVTSVTVSPSSKTMNIGNSAYLYETVCPTNATNKCVKWSSNKTSVATVNPDTGLVIAQGAGTATITATAQDGSNKKGYCTITVNPPIAVTGVDVCPTSVTMNVGDIEYLCASITPSNATNQTVTWCSSNENVATVGLYTGRISANMAGTTTITATTADGGFTASCTVSVKQVLTGADLYIDDIETKNLIIQYKTTYDYIQSAYFEGTINVCQKNEQQNSILQAINIARADYVILNPQSDFVYQYFKGRNHKVDDISPFIRESYTYPNSGYNDSKDVLAIIIIQRSLELLGFFEPPNEYEYGVYDQETHDAVLTSPFYILGSNDFQKYSYYDMLGSTTLSERTKSNVKLLHKMRLFHNEVADRVALKVAPNSRTHKTTIYKKADHSKWGFADVMKTAVSNEYIWEVKPWSQRYRVLNSMASIQLGNYINAWNNSEIDQKYSPRLPALPGYNIGKFAFRSQITGQIVVVESNPAIAPDIRSGLVHYYPTEDDNEYQEEYATEYALETEAVPVTVPTFDYGFDSSISFGTVQITGMAEVAGKIFAIAVIGAVFYYVTPYLLPALLAV